MNLFQGIWWDQVKVDFGEFQRLRRLDNSPVCHRLHFLQMATEKLSKAYFWRSGKAPPKTHVSFVNFLKALLNRTKSDRSRIARLLGFGTDQNFENWVRAVSPLAYQLERLAPSLANDGPNPEYPWPNAKPEHSPATFTFPVWSELNHTAQGRHLIKVIEVAIIEFPQFS